MCFQLNKVIPRNSNGAWDHSHTREYPVLDSGPTKEGRSTSLRRKRPESLVKTHSIWIIYEMCKRQKPK